MKLFLLGFAYHSDDFYDFPYRGYGDSGAWAAVASILFFIGIILLIALAVNLVVYILRSIGLYRLAVNRGMSNPGLAWIPVIGQYRIGSVTDNISAQNGSTSYFRYILLAGLVVSNVFSGVFNGFFLPAITSMFTDLFEGDFLYNDYSGLTLYDGLSQIIGLVGLAVYVIMIIALNKIYQTYRPYSATAWTVLSVIFPFLQGIFLFALRNNMPFQQYPENGGYYPPHNPAAGYPPPPPYLPNNGGYYPSAPQPPVQGVNPQYPAYPQQPDWPQQNPQAAAAPADTWKISSPEPTPAEPWQQQNPQAAAAPADTWKISSPEPAPEEALEQPGNAPPVKTWETPNPEAPTASAKSWETPDSWGVNDNPQNGR